MCDLPARHYLASLHASPSLDQGPPSMRPGAIWKGKRRMRWTPTWLRVVHSSLHRGEDNSAISRRWEGGKDADPPLPPSARSKECARGGTRLPEWAARGPCKRLRGASPRGQLHPRPPSSGRRVRSQTRREPAGTRDRGEWCGGGRPEASRRVGAGTGMHERTRRAHARGRQSSRRCRKIWSRGCAGMRRGAAGTGGRGP